MPPTFGDALGQDEEAITKQMQDITCALSSIMEQAQEVRLA
jgi:hypothetical protein